ncbi:dTDP-4-dehydrorhamnose reductase family protein [Pseudalkalibacillus sp. A8]|uniref:dTDP-4-dehydrorhamnose reductase family protein n=1 Tax=Pseudalkalibacillus sp. A8 TaxID=3382641 RepID=UPI0038B4E1B8
MRVLVLGGYGMAGHMIVKYFTSLKEYDLYYTHRNPKASEGIYLDVRNTAELQGVIRNVKPDIVINCVGILNESAAKHTRDAIMVNSLLPHILKDELSTIGSKLIHISTDCVFIGQKGNYTETDLPDSTSIYGRSKALGEVSEEPHLTIRTSIIGPELKDGIGLFNWFMKQTGEINGFINVFWNGVTTLELAKAVHALIIQNVSGLYHLTAKEPLSKYSLLTKIQAIFEKDDVSIKPYEKMICDRTLLNTREDVEYETPSYDAMLRELREWMD